MQTVTVQALGPNTTGWFDVMTSSPFQIMNNDMDILVQSHKTGFYAWEQAPEDDPDETADAAPIPWDRGDSEITDLAAAATDIALGCSAPAAPAASTSHELQQADIQSVSLGQGVEEQQQQPPCMLRMLVYVHYEQLLQMLPCQLQQSLSPVATLQQSQQRLQQQRNVSSAQACALQIAANKDTVLWLHIDVCQLRGGVRLGFCTAALRAADWDAAVSASGDSCDRVEFKVQRQQVLAVLYNPACSINCSITDSRSSGVATSCFGTTSASEHQSGSRSVHGMQCSPVAGMSSTAVAEDEQLVMLGQQQLFCSSTGASSTGDDGLVMASAADVLKYLLSKDEVRHHQFVHVCQSCRSVGPTHS